jgi:biotin transport system substrate-specific component
MSATNSATLLNVLTSATARRDVAGVSFVVPMASVLFITALTAAAAQISVPLPFTDVPLTLQPMVVLIGGLALGSRLGSASQILYLAAGLAGLPVFAASATLPPGPLRLLGPTGGYLMAYPFAAFAAGWLAERGLDRKYAGSFLAMLGGLVIIFAAGITWLAFFGRTVSGNAPIGLAAALATGLYPFLVADIIKLAIAAGLVPAVWRAVGPPR